MGVTQAQGVQWAKNSIGRAYDFDGAFGIQCFDLINQYAHDLFGISFRGAVAKDLMQTGNVGGFRVIPNTANFYPLPGDIFVYTNGSAGHTGIVLGSVTTTGFIGVDQNGRSNNEPSTQRAFNYAGFAGVVRPPFTVVVQPFPSRPCKVKVGNIVLLTGGAKVTSPWSSNENIPANMVNNYYRVERVEKLNEKWQSSEYQVLINSDASSYRKWIYEQDLLVAPAAKFKKGMKVRLSTGATNASRYWSRRILEKKFLGQEYTIGDVVATAESQSPYQYLISSNTLGNLWVLEQDLADRTIRFITNEPFMNQEHNQNPEVKNKNLYKTVINNISKESTAKLMAEFTRSKTLPMLTNGNVFLIEYPTHLMVKVVGVKLDSTASVKAECLRLTKGQIPKYNERDMKVVLQTNKKYNWIEIDNLPKDWQAISNRLRYNLRERFCQYFLDTRVSYGKQSDGKFYFQIINIENKERATELAAKLKGWFPGDTNEYTNAQIFLQR
ncbi:CHAP domain-containing protein [Enterococcus termitis]